MVSSTFLPLFHPRSVGDIGRYSHHLVCLSCPRVWAVACHVRGSVVPVQLLRDVFRCLLVWTEWFGSAWVSMGLQMGPVLDTAWGVLHLVCSVFQSIRVCVGLQTGVLCCCPLRWISGRPFPLDLRLLLVCCSGIVYLYNHRVYFLPLILANSFQEWPFLLDNAFPLFYASCGLRFDLRYSLPGEGR